MTSPLKELVVGPFLLGQPLGFSSEIDLAKAFVANSVTERWEMLKGFYVDKNPVLSGVSCLQLDQ